MDFFKEIGLEIILCRAVAIFKGMVEFARNQREHIVDEFAVI